MKKGWKVFDKDLKCRGVQFKVGETFTQSGEPVLCQNGFHFHLNKSHLFNYYEFNTTNRVCEVTAMGKVVTEGDKSCTNKIKVVRELSWVEVLTLINNGENNTGRNNTGDRNTGDRNTGDRNTGSRNTGYWNTGDRNTGHRNTGDRNTGHWNTGDRNTGHWNTGDRNTGDWNTGHWNTGDRNTGHWNTGDRNTGDWNTCNFSAGVFNTIEQPTPIFNGAATVMMSEFRNSKYMRALNSSVFPITEWVYESDMTEKEKADHPKFYVQEGFLRVRTFTESCAIWWENMSDDNRAIIQQIPGFSKDIFHEVTGIKL